MGLCFLLCGQDRCVACTQCKGWGPGNPRRQGNPRPCCSTAGNKGTGSAGMRLACSVPAAGHPAPTSCACAPCGGKVEAGGLGRCGDGQLAGRVVCSSRAQHHCTVHDGGPKQRMASGATAPTPPGRVAAGGRLFGWSSPPSAHKQSVAPWAKLWGMMWPEPCKARWQACCAWEAGAEGGPLDWLRARAAELVVACPMAYSAVLRNTPL
jgi:hypothetical protein